MVTTLQQGLNALEKMSTTALWALMTANAWGPNLCPKSGIEGNETGSSWCPQTGINFSSITSWLSQSGTLPTIIGGVIALKVLNSLVNRYMGPKTEEKKPSSCSGNCCTPSSPSMEDLIQLWIQIQNNSKGTSLSEAGHVQNFRDSLRKEITDDVLHIVQGLKDSGTAQAEQTSKKLDRYRGYKKPNQEKESELREELARLQAINEELSTLLEELKTEKQGPSPEPIETA